MKVYIAAPLFNEMEVLRNEQISALLEKEGISTYLPQRDGGIFYEMERQGFSHKEIKDRIFRTDYLAVAECDLILCLLDGRVLDEGMCIELGMAYALGKKCIGYKTDHRDQDKFGNNIMLDGVLRNIFNTRSELIEYLSEICLTEVSNQVSVAV